MESENIECAKMIKNYEKKLAGKKKDKMQTSMAKKMNASVKLEKKESSTSSASEGSSSTSDKRNISLSSEDEFDKMIKSKAQKSQKRSLTKSPASDSSGGNAEELVVLKIPRTKRASQFARMTASRGIEYLSGDLSSDVEIVPSVNIEVQSLNQETIDANTPAVKAAQCSDGVQNQDDVTAENKSDENFSGTMMPPKKIIGILGNGDGDNNEILFLVELKKNKDATEFCMRNKDLKELYPQLLIDFYTKRLKFSV